MIYIRSKASVISLALVAVLMVGGFVYAFKKNQDKANVLAKSAEAKNVEMQSADTNVPAQEESNVQGDQQITTEEASADQTATADAQTTSGVSYPVHQNVSVTYFWAGEEADKDNKNISNLPSAWDDDWTKHFGGIDNPKKRSGYVVASFTPKENSFYFALPYNDFDENGNRKKDVNKVIPWASSKKWGANESICKNQWIKITKGGKTAYAQWEDVGPFGEDDSAYVFGSAKPKSKTNDTAGLDVSPAAKDYLGLSDVDKVDWQFVDASQVPDGPWKKTLTTSQIYWN